MTVNSLTETERWFIRRGLPHLISDYNAAEDVFTFFRLRLENGKDDVLLSRSRHILDTD